MYVRVSCTPIACAASLTQAIRNIAPLRLNSTVVAINVAIIVTGLNDGGDDCFNVMDEPTILVSLMFNFVLGKCALLYGAPAGRAEEYVAC